MRNGERCVKNAKLCVARVEGYTSKGRYFVANVEHCAWMRSCFVERMAENVLRVGRCVGKKILFVSWMDCRMGMVGVCA